MSAREQLREYLRQLHRRFRLHATLRGAAVVALSALAATVVLVAVANRYAFSAPSLAGSRAVLLLALAVAAVLGLAIPLRKLTTRSALQRAERRFPEFNQRLATFADREQSPFAELLAADTMAVARMAPPASFAPDGRLYASIGLGLACLGMLVWLIAAGPGYWGYGASLLWTGPRAHALPLYALEVQPGNASVRRHSDLQVTALARGLAAPEVRIFARYGAAAAWQEAPMVSRSGAPGFHYLFPAVPQDFEYYAEAGPLRSPTYRVKVRDLPMVKQIAATYHYPAWTGLPTASNLHAGDLRAVAGTVAELTITTDQPLPDGMLVLDPGQPIALQAVGKDRYKASLPMPKDGVYHVAARLPGDDAPTRLTEDYFIAAPPPAPPQIALTRPGRDYRASPIEEVTVAAQASDEFGLKELNLHYSINGGAEKVVPLLPHPGTREAKGKTTISFESFHAQPGDLVSVYASARDGHAESRSDMVFIQADPFERDFSQSQQAGGSGGGQGNISAQIADREKEIIAQTFKQQHTQAFTTAAGKLAGDTAKLLSSSQSTLHDQALSLSGRMDSRELTAENQAFTEFQQDMMAAAQAMAPAATSLSGQNWSAALPDEEKALRNLLRADATFRAIEIAFGAQGGGGGGSSAGRDLASMFNLELDNQKNQYETQPTASSAEQKAQKINDALQKLDQLAQRQQQMAQAGSPQQAAEQRWQQDLLRREAEQLQQQLQQMAQNAAAAASAGQTGQASTSSTASPSSSSSGQSSAAAATQAALNRLRQANQAMQRAASPQESPAQAAADARQAAQALEQARDALSRLQQQNAGDRLAGMQSEAGQLAQEQKRQADQVRQLIATHKQPTQQQMNQLIQGRQAVSSRFDQLEKQLRAAAAELNSSQPGASGRIRSALDAADGNDLGTRLQRSADWLRNGDFSDQNETALTQDLRQLSRNLGQAQAALGSAKGSASNAALASAMDQLERLRQQIAQLGGNGNPAAGSSGRSGVRGGATNGNRQSGPIAGGQNGYNSGRVGNAPGGGYRYQYGNGGYDLGNTHIVGQAVAPQAGPNPADMQRAIQQDLDALNRLRPALPQDAATQRQIQDLIHMTQGLDPSRFPGNPAMLAEMHQQLLSSVDALELQIRQRLDDSQGGQIRGRAPEPVPAGYAAAVAAYYRKLSGGGH